jgi:hypothetical protein
MEFRRNSHSDERRRRVLIEDAGLNLPESPSPPRRGDDAVRASCEPVRTYTEAALSPRQHRVVDLIPTRRWTMLLLALLAIAMATGLEAIYGYVALGSTPLRIDQVPAVDLAAPGSVADWFSSCLLLAAAGLGVLTYLIRRHRADDYRGRYRMWYWVVPLLVLASLEQVADLQTSLRTTLLVLAGIPDYADATLIWSGIVAVITTAVAVRLALEMRACRLAVVSLIVALACYAARQAAELNWILEVPDVFRVMATAGLGLIGNVHLFLALCLYSRHVYRDARGEVAPKARKSSPPARARRQQRSESATGRLSTAATPASAAAASSLKDAKIRVDQPHTTTATTTTTTTTAAAAKQDRPRGPAEPSPTPAAPKHSGLSAVVAARAATGPTDDAELEDDDGTADSKLSKAERRRLRKLQRREKRQP